jgi:hypothetical protein
MHFSTLAIMRERRSVLLNLFENEQKDAEGNTANSGDFS